MREIYVGDEVKVVKGLYEGIRGIVSALPAEDLVVIEDNFYARTERLVLRRDEIKWIIRLPVEGVP